MIATLGDWLPVAAMAALETAVALSMFVPAYGMAALVMAARRRQLAREMRPSERPGLPSFGAAVIAQRFIDARLDTGVARCIIARRSSCPRWPPAMTESR